MLEVTTPGWDIKTVIFSALCVVEQHGLNRHPGQCNWLACFVVSKKNKRPANIYIISESGFASTLRCLRGPLAVDTGFNSLKRQ